MNSSVLKLGVPAAALALLLSGCLASKPNPVQQMADSMVGKPISVAIKAFGQPNGLNLPPCSYCTDGGSYAWSNTRMSPTVYQEWVQTGTATDQRIIGMTQGGNGIASMPIYENTEVATGEYRPVQGMQIDYLCEILATTDMKDLIKTIQVTGCTEASRY